MSIKFAKKVLAAGLAAVTLAMPVSAETEVFFNDGYVAIKGSSNFLREGATLTVTAVEKGTEWGNFEDIASVPKEKIEFYGTFFAGHGGEYSVEFSPANNGEYTVYVGAPAFDDPRKYEICYINKTGFEAAAGLLNANQAKEEFAGILAAKKDELGLFHPVFNHVDMQKMTELAKADILALKDQEPLQMIDILEKAALIVELNAENVENIALFSDIAKLAENKYFGNEISKEITANMSGKNIGMDGFDKLLLESIIIANVNHKSSGTVREVLNTYYQEIGIPQSKITDELCAKIVQKGNFTSLNELAIYINAYTPENPVVQGGIGGGFGGGSGGGGPVSKLPAVPVQNESKVTDQPLQNESGSAEQNTFKLPFEDMQGYEWAEDAIRSLYLKAIVNGKGEKSFCPDEPVTREEFVKMIALAFRMNLVDGDMNFTDVPDDAWFTPYVRTSYNAKIVNGLNKLEFGVGKNITREDLCVMISRALYAGDLTLTGDTVELIAFDDAENVSDYAKDAVKQLSGAGIIHGFEGKFRPQDSATRAEAAKIIYMITQSAGL